MDSTTRTNFLILLGAAAVVAGLSLLIFGVQQGSPIRLAVGVIFLAVAVTLFRLSGSRHH